MILRYDEHQNSKNVQMGVVRVEEKIPKTRNAPENNFSHEVTFILFRFLCFRGLQEARFFWVCQATVISGPLIFANATDFDGTNIARVVIFLSIWLFACTSQNRQASANTEISAFFQT